jgi:pilus assembly protein TadC
VTMLVLSAALFAALAVVVLLPTSTAARARLGPLDTAAAPRRRLPRVVAPIGAGLLAVWLLGGVVGWLLGAAVMGLLLRRGASRVSQQDVQRTTRRTLELPVAIDLLASCLLVGTTPDRALHEVAVAVGGSLADDLETVAAAMQEGAAADEAWSLVDAADLQSVASLLRRTSTTGAAVAPMLSMLAEQHRQAARLVALDAARTLGVRATGPLGLCFLPAFVLVAVVPLVVSLLPWGLLVG